jgi:hypothetical protein
MPTPFGYYVELDCLLDTRLGALNYIDHEFAFEVSSNPSYYRRQVDRFSTKTHGAIDINLYKQIKSTRANDVLRASVMTRVPIVLGKLLSYQHQLADYADSFDVGLTINVSPYQLSDAEKKAIEEIFTNDVLFDGVRIDVVDIPLTQVTVDYIEKNFVAMMLYDPTQWIETHQKDFLLAKLSNVSLYVPKINRVRALNAVERTQAERLGTDYYIALETVMKRHIRYTHLSVSVFSACTPLNDGDSL